MANVTRAHIEHLHGKMQHLHKRATALRERAEKMTEKFVRTLEVGAAATVGGIVQGKSGPDGAHVLGVPVDLGAGLALNVLGYFEVAGKHSDHLNNLGDGMLAAYLAQVGFGMGKNWHDTGKLLGKPGTTTSTQGALNAAQMARLAQTMGPPPAQQMPAAQPAAMPLAG